MGKIDKPSGAPSATDGEATTTTMAAMAATAPPTTTTTKTGHPWTASPPHNN